MIKKLSLSLIVTAMINICAYADLVVIGNKDILINNLSVEQIAAIYLGKSVTLSTGEKLVPIDQNSNSAIYRQFYQQMTNMDPASVSSYWAKMIFSNSSAEPPEVDSDLVAIADVENHSKAIAYVESQSLGSQSQNIKILYGAFQSAADTKVLPPPADSHVVVQQSHFATDDDLRAKLSQEIATLRIEEARYQQLNQEREAELLAILRAEQKSPYVATPLPVETDMSASAFSTDLWASMRAHFSMTDTFHSDAINRELAWYMRNKWVAQMVINNSAPYIAYMYQQVLAHHMPAEFALLPMVESGYYPFAVSSAGASGLWQLMPETAADYHLKTNWWYDGRRDVVRSTQVALDYLNNLYRDFHTWPLAAAAYDAGGKTVSTAITYNKTKGLPIDYWSLMLPEETKRYVPKLLALAVIVNDPAKYGVTLPKLTTTPEFTTVMIQSQVDKTQLANLTGTSPALIYRLNPSMLRFATDPTIQNYPIQIPTNTLSAFQANITHLTLPSSPSWIYHAMQGGESLENVADQYHITLAELEKINSLSSDITRSGQGILVPSGSSSQQRSSSFVQAASVAVPLQQQQPPIAMPEVQALAVQPEASMPTPAATPMPPQNESWQEATPLPPEQRSQDLKTLLNRLY